MDPKPERKINTDRVLHVRLFDDQMDELDAAYGRAKAALEQSGGGVFYTLAGWRARQVREAVDLLLAKEASEAAARKRRAR